MNQAIKELQQTALYDVMRRFPDVPYPSVKPFTDATANGLQKCIIRFLQLKGHQAERIAVTGRRLDRTKIVTDCLGHRKRIGSVKWIHSSMQPGTADLSAVINGKAIKIEVKINKDVQSDAQKSYQQQIEQAGGIYFIATSFEQFYQWYNETFR